MNPTSARSARLTELAKDLKNDDPAVVLAAIRAGADVNFGSDGTPPLVHANNPDIIKILLDNGANVNAAKDTTGLTALHKAIEINRPDIVKLLVEKGADVNLAFRGGSPLMRASFSGYIDIVKLLLDNGADVGAKDNSGYTAFHASVQAGQMDVSKLLLAKGADVNAQFPNGLTPLRAAIGGKRSELAMLLIQNGAIIDTMDEEGVTALARASSTRLDNVVDLLIRQGANVNIQTKEKGTPLIIAASTGRLSIVQRLLDAGADISIKRKDGKTAMDVAATEEIKQLLQSRQQQYDNSLFQASKSGDVAHVKNAIALGAHVDSKDARGSTPLLAAVADGHVDVMQVLLAKGANVNVPFTVISPSKEAAVINTLVDHGVDVNTMNINGLPPIMNPFALGDADLVRKLITRGANINVRERESGYTPLLAASSIVNRQVVDILLTSGADVNAQDGEGNTSLMLAALAGSREVVQLLLDKGADPHVKNRQGKDVALLPIDQDIKKQIENKQLIDAAMTGDSEKVKTIINTKGINVNVVDMNGSTPLLLAAWKGHIEIVRLLLTHGVDITTKAKNGATSISVSTNPEIKNMLAYAVALLQATIDGDVAKVKSIVDNGYVDVDIANNDGDTPLILAARKGHIKLMEVLIEKGADENKKNKNGETALTVVNEKASKSLKSFALLSAASTGDVAQAKKMIEAGADVNVSSSVYNGTPLIMATHYEDVEIVELLLSPTTTVVAQRVDVNAVDQDGYTALMIASKAGAQRIVKMLLANGALTNVGNNVKHTPLMFASENGHVDSVRMLLDKGAYIDDVNSDEDTALILASYSGHETVVKLLIKYDANVNIANSDGETALICACKEGHADIVKLLLNAGARIDHANEDGDTALTLASYAGHESVVTLLLNKRAKVDWMNKDGTTALMFACQQGYTDVVEALASKSKDLDIRDDDGNTALLEAARKGYTDIVELLVSKGANMHLANNDGETAETIANDDVYAFLAEQITDSNAYTRARGSFREHDGFYFFRLMKFGVEMEILHDFMAHQDIEESDRNIAFANGLNSHRRYLEDDTLERKYYHYLAADGRHGQTFQDDTIPDQPSWGKSTWRIEHDGSVERIGADDDGYVEYTEIVSPVLSVWKRDNVFTCSDFGPNVLKNVVYHLMPKVIVGGGIRDVYYKVNESCSMHIHVSCMEGNTNHFKTPHNLAVVCMYWRVFENTFESLLEPSRLKKKNKYFANTPRILPSEFVYMSTHGRLTVKNIVKLVNGGIGDDYRYKSLNLQNLVNRRGIGTIEVRMHQGLYDPKPMSYWAFLMTLFFNYALDQAYNNTLEQIASNVNNLSRSLTNNRKKFNHLFNNIIKSSDLGYWYSDVHDEFYPDNIIDYQDDNAKSIMDEKVQWILDMIFSSAFWDT